MIQLVLFIFQSALGLEPDLSLSVSMRTRPIGAQLRAEGGYGYLLWGQKQPNQPPLYGYIRPGARVGTSLLVNNAEVYFDFYPISFLGIRFRHYQDIRSTKFPGIDCIVYACKSRLQSNKIKANFATGYRSLFLLADYQLDFWSNSTQDRNFVEEQSMLPAGDYLDRSHDMLKTLTLTMGYRISETLRFGFTHTHQAMQKSKTYANNSILHYSQSNGDTTYIVGAGHHDSPFFQSGPLLLGMVRWTLFPSISLF